ncbi:MAG: SprB repeat-containing protein [Bacteroidetes bacterium]|nr:SprB repeat-containing protein [Bacteroidota bacterium]
MDAFNCPNTLTVAVSEPGQLTISGIVDSVSCNSGADGSIDLTVTGGTSPIHLAGAMVH